MATPPSSAGSTLHRVAKGYRWFTIVAVPPLLALMAWAASETVRNYLSDEVDSPLWAVALMLTLYGGVSFALFSGLIWAFRAYARIDTDGMTVQGAYLKTVIQPDMLEGFRIIKDQLNNDQLHVYVKNRSLPVQIAYFEKLWLIEDWIRQRTTNTDDDLLEEEAHDISQDVSLGFHPDEKSQQLAILNKWVRRANVFVYITIAGGAANFLFVGNLLMEQICTAGLVLMPLMLTLTALSHRGHIRIDYYEGTQYPQISTATLASGVTLMLLALLDRGALLNNDLYQFMATGVLISGLLWCLIDQKRLSTMRGRGRAAFAMTVFAFFVIPAAWVGGSLYHLNKLADISEPVWYETTVVEKTRTSGKTTRYTIDLAPWSKDMVGPVRVTLRRREFDLYKRDMPVRVAVRKGAINTPWVADVQPYLLY